MAPLDNNDKTPVPGDEDTLARRAVIHDVNQMLAVITGRAELMLHRGGQGLSREDLETIALAATDAAAMLRRLAGGPAAAFGEPSSCSLADEVRKVGLLVRPPDGKPWADPAPVPPEAGRILDIRVAADLRVALPGQVVREVLANLVLNALEAMPSGGGLVITGARQGSRVTLEVADEGPGLDPDAAVRIFQPCATGHNQPGRGTGLPGCRHLLEGLGAGLELVAGKGPGAVFRLDMTAAKALPEASVLAEPAAPGDGPAVLVVDDEPGVRGMLIDLLGEMGCQASAARNAASARDTFVPGRFAVVLLDQSLPDGTGRELAELMRVRDPFVALVLMTGLDRAEEIERNETGPVDLTAVKPLTWDTIRRLVDQGAALNERRRKAGDS
jgi:CheY-like chemotaxis protein